jgi:DNA-binding NarL/FixJ family response regulator
MIRTLIADDHAVVRMGLRQVLSQAGDITVAAEAGTGQEVLDVVRTKHIDVVILDLSMPGGMGMEVLNKLKRDHPDLPVIVLSMHSEDQYGVLALKAGASGYVTKESAADHLVAAIRKAVAGGKYVSQSLAERLATDLETGTDRPPHERLSEREFQVMRFIAAGKTVTEISQTLGLSSKTVSTYRARVLEKMRMEKNAQLTHYAIKQGLLDADHAFASSDSEESLAQAGS